MFYRTPSSMSRRHYLSHLAGASALTIPALTLGHSLRTHAAELKKNRKAAILLWMGGGPSTIDIWDLKPGTSTGGPFKPISTSGDMQICEHMPQMAKLMDKMAIVRSMSTREADHNRGRYYMHTGYVPNPNIEHPSYGSVVSHEIGSPEQRPELEIPPFVTIGGGAIGPGFLGTAWSPFNVNSNGQIRNLELGNMDLDRMYDRMQALDAIEKSFVSQNRGPAASDHMNVLKKTVNLMTSKQMDAFRLNKEPQSALERYGAGTAGQGNSAFGRGCLMAGLLIETGGQFEE